MNPGHLNKRITIQQFSQTINENGFPVEEWVNIKSVWAMIKTVSGKEYMSAAQTQNENKTRFVIRHITDIHPDMRIVFKNRVFEMQAIINDDEANKTLTIVCKELIQ